jgi:hypothetical protein
VAGNLAFRQASIAPINHAVETAAEALFYARTIANPFNDDFGNNYFASLQPGEITDSGGHLTGVPAALSGNPPSAYPPGFQKRGPDSAGNTVRWVIERICKNGYAGDPISVVGVDNCDLMVPKLTPGRKTNTAGGIAVPPIPIYRVTVRVDGPANTVSFAQAMLR